MCFFLLDKSISVTPHHCLLKPIPPSADSIMKPNVFAQNQEIGDNVGLKLVEQ